MESNISNETLLKSIEELTKKIDKINKEKPYSKSYQSQQTNELNASLAKTFSEYPQIKYNRKDSYFGNDYADLDLILTNMRPLLSKNDLSITTRTIILDSGETILETRLWHSSGQWIESRARLLPSKNDTQTYSSALMHLTRTQIMAILSITVINNPDDDNAVRQMASAREIIARAASGANVYDSKKESFEPISKDQVAEIENEMVNLDDFRSEILDAYRIQSITDLPKSKYRTALNRIREIKNKLGR